MVNRMSGVREAKREELRNRLIAAAEKLVAKSGIRALNAREVTKEAGCALGSLYTVFDDLDDLVIHVNSNTLNRLAEELRNEPVSHEDPVEALKSLAKTYVRFARENLPLWVALFDYAAIADIAVPEWHTAEQHRLIEFIVEPVASLSVNLEGAELSERAKMLFAAVHGIVSLSVEDRFVGVSPDRLEDELMVFIDQMVAGLVRQSSADK